MCARLGRPHVTSVDGLRLHPCSVIHPARLTLTLFSTNVTMCAHMQRHSPPPSHPSLDKNGHPHMQASFFLGDVGAGSKMKLAVNMVMGEMLCALGEGIHLADRSALNPATLIEILGLGAMACPLVTGKGPAMAAGGPFATASQASAQGRELCELGNSTLCPFDTQPRCFRSPPC